MKVLFIGHYRDGSGWAQAAQNYILALDHAGVDIVCRPVKLNSHQATLPERLLEIESRSSKGCDIVIQNVLPHLMDYHGDMYNIGLPFIESTINGTPWPTHLNTMDEVWVTNHSSMENLHNSGVKSKMIGMPINPEDYHMYLEPVDLPTDENFIFYTIGEMGRRKNFVSLIKAFHMEFQPTEPVMLLIKTGKYGMESEKVGAEMKNMCELVKEQLKLHPLHRYKSDIIISNHLKFNQLLNLHTKCHCYVNTSFGEGCCLPAWDAIAMENPLIVPDYLVDDFPNRCTVGYKTHKEPCTGAVETFDFLFTARDEWNVPDINDIRTKMREVYSNYEYYRQTTLEYHEEHNYNEQCEKLKGLLDG